MIYVTPWDFTTNQPTGACADSGFDTIDAVIEGLGQADLIAYGKQFATYGANPACRTCFTAWPIDEPVNSDVSLTPLSSTGVVPHE